MTREAGKAGRAVSTARRKPSAQLIVVSEYRIVFRYGYPKTLVKNPCFNKGKITYNYVCEFVKMVKDQNNTSKIIKDCMEKYRNGLTDIDPEKWTESDKKFDKSFKFLEQKKFEQESIMFRMKSFILFCCFFKFG